MEQDASHARKCIGCYTRVSRALANSGYRSSGPEPTVRVPESHRIEGLSSRVDGAIRALRASDSSGMDRIGMSSW